MIKFKDWFNSKLTVGAYPYMNNEWFSRNDYDYVINVSDEFYFNYDSQITERCKSFWFPMNEVKKDNGLNSIYGAMVILWNAEHENKRVYLHCHAGVHRSQVVRSCYHYMRTNTQLDTDYGGFLNPLMADCARGYLPPIREMEDFLSHLGLQLNNFKGRPMGGLLDGCKLKHIRNF